MRLRSVLLLAGASFLWGSGWILAPSLAEVAAPYAAGALLFAAAALALLPFLFRKPATARVSTHTTLLLAFTLLATPTALLTEAGRHGISGVVPLVYGALPLMVTILGEGWSPTRAPAAVIAISATFVLLNGSVPLTTSKLLWAFPVLVAVGLQASALRYAARLVACSQTALLRSLAIQFALTSAALAGLSLLLDPAPKLAPVAQWAAVPTASLVLLAALGTALPYALLLHLLAGAQLRPEQVAAAQWLQFLFAFAEGAAFARSRPTFTLLTAACVLLACFFMLVRAPEPAGDALLSLHKTHPHQPS